jgi:hypothetical protein
MSRLLLLRLLLQLVLYLPHTREDDVTTFVNYATYAITDKMEKYFKRNCDKKE